MRSFYRAVTAIAAATLAAGCAGWQHARTLPTDQSAMLDVRTAGGERLRIESAYDPAIARYVSAHGAPDVIHVPDAQAVDLVYVTEDRLVHFQRSGQAAESIDVRETPIPAPLRAVLADGGIGSRP